MGGEVTGGRIGSDVGYPEELLKVPAVIQAAECVGRCVQGVTDEELRLYVWLPCSGKNSTWGSLKEGKMHVSWNDGETMVAYVAFLPEDVQWARWDEQKEGLRHRYFGLNSGAGIFDVLRVGAGGFNELPLDT